MPTIIDYSQVIAQMSSQGLICNYYNSGSFGFAKSTPPQILGWLGPPDSTILPAMQSKIRQAPPPYEQSLATAATQFWKTKIPAPAWIMPASHWAFELDFGSRRWLAGVLNQIGIDSAKLAPLTNAAAIQFDPAESEALQVLVQSLLTNLTASDFTIAFPTQQILCTIHHHKQLWWQTTDQNYAAQLHEIFPIIQACNF